MSVTVRIGTDRPDRVIRIPEFQQIIAHVHSYLLKAAAAPMRRPANL
jgi:hypothetical protein